MANRFFVHGKQRFFRATAIAFSILVLLWGILDHQSVHADPATGPSLTRSTALTVTVSAVAMDANGDALSYHWRSSDGQIADVNAPMTKWTLPQGPGLHFAYVLVANGHGGYAEQRVVVSTDVIGGPVRHGLPTSFVAPAAPVPKGETYHTFSNAADLLYFAVDDNNSLRFPRFGYSQTDLKNQMIMRGMLPVASEDIVHVNCDPKFRGPFGECGEISPFSDANGVLPPTNIPPNQAVTDYISRSNFGGYAPDYSMIRGQVVMADGIPCGTQNEFFNVESTATAALLNARGRVVGGPARLNAYGYYEFPSNATAAKVEIRCERAPAMQITLAYVGDQPQAVIPNTGAPVVSSMAAQLADGSVVGSFSAPVPGSAPSQPSDVIKQADKFLAYKGLDSRLGACMYYKAVGAVKDCDRSGNPIGAVRFDDWKRTVEIDQYARPGTPEYAATYINKADLNLARNHRSISYGPDRTAAYVCNHLGPKVLDPDQAEIDQVIDNAVNGRNLVACVAMDYTSTPGVNDGKPFTRFLIFAPSGDLLTSVNLDGRREKFVPGTCVVCHGGDHYAGRFQERGDGPANIGAHFLPYDTGNFLFSAKPGLTEADQADAIYHLNQNVLQAGPTVAAQELIAGWYANGTTALDKTYLPPSWQGRGELASNFYHKVIATSCRGCHMAQVEGYNWDHYDNVNTTQYRGSFAGDLTYTVGCGGANDTFRAHGMPNSLVTFNRFWNSAGNPSDDQPQIFRDFIASLDADYDVQLNCTPSGP